MDGVKSKSDLGQHIGHLELNKLVLGQRSAELLTLHCVLSSLVEAELCGSHGSPCYSKTRLIETAEGSLEALDIEHIFFRDLHVIHHNHTCR